MDSQQMEFDDFSSLAFLSFLLPLNGIVFGSYGIKNRIKNSATILLIGISMIVFFSALLILFPISHVAGVFCTVSLLAILIYIFVDHKRINSNGVNVGDSTVLLSLVQLGFIFIYYAIAISMSSI